MSIVLFIWWRLGITYENYLVDQKRTTLQKRTEEIGANLASKINRRQALLTGLAVNVKTHSLEVLRDYQFESFASGLRANDPAIRAIQFFPKIGFGMVFPFEGDPAVTGQQLDDLINNAQPDVRADVQHALETRQITLSNPRTLGPDEQEIVARLAVYNNEEFLGLVSIMLNLVPLLDVPGLSPAPTDVQFALQDTQGNLFYGNNIVFSSNPVVSKIILPEGSWTLGASPLSGWSADFKPQMSIFWLVGILVACLSGGIAYLVSTSQVRLRKTVRQRTATLAESEAHYRALVEGTPGIIYTYSNQRGGIYYSPRVKDILGYSPEQLLAQPALWHDSIHPDDLPRVDRNIREAAFEKAYVIKYRIRDANGKWLWLIDRSIRYQVKDTDVIIEGLALDITERKYVENQLRESEAKFHSLFINNHAPMMLIAPETGAIIDANSAACDFYGWNHTEIITKNISEINIMSEAETKVDMQKAVHEQRWSFQFQHRLANQDIRDVEVLTGPIEHEGRTLLYSIIHDMTKLKQSEKIIQKSELHYRSLFNNMLNGFAYCQMIYENNIPRDFIYLDVNKEFEKLTGLKDVVGKRVSEVIPGFQESDPELLAIYGRAALTGNPEIIEIYIESLKDWYSESVYSPEKGFFVAVFDVITERKQAEEKLKAALTDLQRMLAEADESRLALLSVVEDQGITEEKLSQLNAELEQRVHDRTAQLEAANNELEAFSYSVSHDLRAPLRGIDGWSLALMEDYHDQLDENGRKYVDRVRNEAQRMGQLIDDLLRLSRVTRAEMKRRLVNLSELARTIADRLQEENAQHPVELIIQPGLTAIGDANMLEIVLTNLLSNAWKFTGKQPQPRIDFGKTSIDGKPVYFIRDNGAGFDMAFSKKLFGAFQRMHKLSEFPGTGIGLATVQRIIHRHRGRVWAEAVKNQGATFFFTLEEDK